MKEKSGYKEVVIDSDLIPEEPVVPEWYQSGIFNPLAEETSVSTTRIALH